MLRQNFTQPLPVKLLINIGSLMDIPTGSYIKGVYGESILLGGLGALTGIVGRGNRFKSTIMHYMMLSAADRLSSTAETSMSTYDTEINIHESRLVDFSQRFDSFRNKNIIQSGEWVVTDKTVYLGDKWFEEMKKYIQFKKDNETKLTFDTPFISRDGKTPMKIIIPTFSEVDSFTEFETSDVAKMQDENELGDSGGNMIHQRQGLAKTRFLMEVPVLAGATNHFFLMTAHMGVESTLGAGPYAQAPVKKLQHMKQGDAIKGVTPRFTFLMNNCWDATTANPLINQNTKGPEYPRNPDDNAAGDMDLMLVTIKQLRGKAGPSGISLELVVSQSEGVLPSLTEFNYIKSSDRFGLNGSLQNYSLDLYPDVKLSRTTIRNKIDTDSKLRRALNITSELCQMHQYYRYLHNELCTAKELYDDLKKLGYDWDELLSTTRGWWTVNSEKHPLKFLSTMDLINIRNGKYKPFWVKK